MIVVDSTKNGHSMIRLALLMIVAYTENSIVHHGSVLLIELDKVCITISEGVQREVEVVVVLLFLMAACLPGLGRLLPRPDEAGQLHLGLRYGRVAVAAVLRQIPVRGGAQLVREAVGVLELRGGAGRGGLALCQQGGHRVAELVRPVVDGVGGVGGQLAGRLVPLPRAPARTAPVVRRERGGAGLAGVATTGVRACARMAGAVRIAAWPPGLHLPSPASPARRGARLGGEGVVEVVERHGRVGHGLVAVAGGPGQGDPAAVAGAAQPALGRVVPGPVEGDGGALGGDEGGGGLRGGPEGGGAGDVGPGAATRVLLASGAGAGRAGQQVQWQCRPGGMPGSKHVDRGGAR